LSRTATYLIAQFQEAGLEAEEQVFVAATPRGPIQFRNVVAHTLHSRGGDNAVVVIGSHYDTKWMTNGTFVGANDGASSVGVLLEMARVAANTPNLWFVLFDGEEAVVEYGPNDGLRGSRFFVESLKGDRHVKWVKAMLLFDMVGDARLNVTIPGNSTPALVDHLFTAARATGWRDYFSYRDMPMLDDHVPFLEVGIPAIDIIDFEYGRAPGLNDYWHTDKDTLDKLSPRSLEIVGQTGLRLLDAVVRGPALK
jgi:Zn-dependent M28 family amino/carboxypeptidase